MRILKYLAAVWFAVIFYAVSSLFAGAAGFSTYSQLNAEKEKQIANLRKLQAINQDIRGRKEALIYDDDTISIYARELGYGGGGERFIRIRCGGWVVMRRTPRRCGGCTKSNDGPTARRCWCWWILP